MFYFAFIIYAILEDLWLIYPSPPQLLQWHRENHVTATMLVHDDVIKWKHFPRNWPFVRGIHRSPVNFPHKGQWRGALMFSLIYAWINDWVNNREAGDLRRQHGHYDVIVMEISMKDTNTSIWHQTTETAKYEWHENVLNVLCLASASQGLVPCVKTDAMLT